MNSIRLASLATGLSMSAPGWAGTPSGVGSSTLTLSWSGSAVAVPTLGTAGTIALAALVALVAFRVLRQQGPMVRMLAPAAGMGLVLGGGFWAQDLTAGLASPPINVANCNGSQTYTADGPTPPPCFVNECGGPVTVQYTFVEGEDGFGTPLTAESCTFDYYCDDASEGNTATPGATIPSDGQPYATAYCGEIFNNENGPGPGID